MNLDIRLPMGLMFSLFGIILTGYGIATKGDAMYEHSLGHNINLLWGIVLLAFGAVMVALAARAMKKGPAPAP